ncbi:MAG: hypothetical protein QOG53_2271 [Frankiales bacterium]|nr:hypothetical protein [Frankiales bacterium]
MSPQRTLWSDLRSIDRAIVPRLATLVERIQRGMRDLGPTVDRGRGGPRATSQRLDGRYARRGALALVRDVPQVGLAALTLLLVVAAVTVAARSGSPTNNDSGGLDLPTVSGVSALTVGPIAGGVADYLAGARADLLARAQQAPHDPTFAIADFDRPLTPEDAARAVPGVEVKQIFLRIRAASATQYFPSTNVDFVSGVLKSPLQVSGLPDGARTVYEGVAAALLQQAKDSEQFVASINLLPTPTADDLEQKAAQSTDARRFRAWSGALRTHCACIYAVVIRAEAQTLANIANSGKVRVVDAALTGIPYDRLKWVPLSPDLKDGDQYRRIG